MPHIETSDKSIIFGYRRKPTIENSQPENLYCYYHQIPIKKVRFGRFWHCPQCRGKVRFPSGKAITRRK